MRPTYEEFLAGSCRWYSTVDRRIKIKLNFHGARDARMVDGHYNEREEGTWCWYLLIPQQMYVHRWSDFLPERSEHGFYRDDTLSVFEDVPFHGGITWFDVRKVYCRKDKCEYDLLEVGCDYNHYYDRESGYPDTYESVLGDATRAARQFLAKNSDYRFQSDWSGLWGYSDEMILCVNGRWIHPSDDIPEKYGYIPVGKEADVAQG